MFTSSILKDCNQDRGLFKLHNSSRGDATVIIGHMNVYELQSGLLWCSERSIPCILVNSPYSSGWLTVKLHSNGPAQFCGDKNPVILIYLFARCHVHSTVASKIHFY